MSGWGAVSGLLPSWLTDLHQPSLRSYLGHAADIVSHALRCHARPMKFVSVLFRCPRIFFQFSLSPTDMKHKSPSPNIKISESEERGAGITEQIRPLRRRFHSDFNALVFQGIFLEA